MSPFDPAPFVERRQRFAAAIGDGLAIIPGAREAQRNGDVNFEFRQASDFYFLTGFDEPDAIAVFNPADAKERFVLFVRPRDREMEIWNGRRAPSRPSGPTRRTRSTGSTRSCVSTCSTGPRFSTSSAAARSTAESRGWSPI
jgi:Xaa-Pro aminopeptidase